MNRESFLQNDQVASFVNWLASNAKLITANFSILSSHKVPGGVKGLFTGLEEIKNGYRWKAQWELGDECCCSINWETTRDSLKKLSEHLRYAIASKDNNYIKQVLWAVFTWGGDRNSRVGAAAFVNDNDARLVDYFQSSSKALSLTDADLNENMWLKNEKKPELVNAMLTKVYALLSDDGLPIYDSRVAGAIATLVEIWRITPVARGGGNGQAIVTRLLFPSTDRAVRRSVPACVSNFQHGYIGRQDRGRGRPTDDWISAKIRLGWLLKAVIQENRSLFQEEGSDSQRMHAFEAALFMIGYDTSSLCGNVH